MGIRIGEEGIQKGEMSMGYKMMVFCFGVLREGGEYGYVIPDVRYYIAYFYGFTGLFCVELLLFLVIVSLRVIENTFKGHLRELGFSFNAKKERHPD